MKSTSNGIQKNKFQKTPFFGEVYIKKRRKSQIKYYIINGER